MKTNRILCRANISLLVIALSAAWACASDDDKGAVQTTGEAQTGDWAAATQSSDESRLARLLKEASFSQGVSEVVRMADRGTDASVLTAYVQNSDTAYRLRPEDIAHLREHGVTDSVITAMIERGAELRAQPPPAPQPVPPAQPAIQPTVQIPQVQPANTVTFVPAFSPPESPAVSTLLVIGHSNLRRGLSYRNYYYSPRHYFSTTPYDSVYASFGNYARYGYGGRHRRVHGYRVCR